jgi:uncharacterized protein
MRRISLAIGSAAATLLAPPSRVALHLPAARQKVLAFFTPGGELDHFLYARQAMRAFGAAAQAGGYAFAPTSDWDALNEANLTTQRRLCRR